MVVHYQPAIELASGNVVFAEVFCRFPAGAGETEDLATFIPRAEAIGLIGKLTESIVSLAFTERATWPVALPLAFNVSRLDLEDPTFFERTTALFERFGADPRTTTFEIGEGVQSTEEGNGLGAMRRLRALGVRLAVDGFGPTFSSFSHIELERVGISEVKIEAGGVNDAEFRAKVRGIVGLCGGAGVDVVAKGVESCERLQLVRDLGCGYAQGFEIARPMAADAFVTWLAEHALAPLPEPLPLPAPAPVETPARGSRTLFSKIFGK